MARGWESKSIESQQEDRARPSMGRGGPMSAEERERREKRHTLELSRARVVGELESARADARRASLQEALAYLDAALEELGP